MTPRSNCSVLEVAEAGIRPPNASYESMLERAATTANYSIAVEIALRFVKLGIPTRERVLKKLAAASSEARSELLAAARNQSKREDPSHTPDDESRPWLELEALFAQGRIAELREKMSQDELVATLPAQRVSGLHVEIFALLARRGVAEKFSSTSTPSDPQGRSMATTTRAADAWSRRSRSSRRRSTPIRRHA